MTPQPSGAEPMAAVIRCPTCGASILDLMNPSESIECCMAHIRSVLFQRDQKIAELEASFKAAPERCPCCVSHCASPERVWRGECGHLWEIRFDDEKPECPFCKKIAELEKAGDAVFNRYLDLANSGDAGKWNPEEEECVKAWRKIREGR